LQVLRRDAALRPGQGWKRLPSPWHIAAGSLALLLQPFRLARFAETQPVGKKVAAASH
jgi:hypothetical protein